MTYDKISKKIAIRISYLFNFVRKRVIAIVISQVHPLIIGLTVYTENKLLVTIEDDESMASLPKLERFLFTLSTGITGLELLNDYEIQSTELQYFINFCKEPHDLSVSAMGPSALTQRDNDRIRESYTKIMEKMAHFDSKNNTKEKTDKIIMELTDLHDLIGKVYDVSKAVAVPF